MKLMLASFIIHSKTANKTFRRTFLTSDKFFEGDVNKLNSELREGESINAVDLYTIYENLQTAIDFWRELSADKSIHGMARDNRFKERFPFGVTTRLEV